MRTPKEGEMRMKLLLLLLVATATAGIAAALASASGPATPGKELVQLTCDGLGMIAVSAAGRERQRGGPDRRRQGSRHPSRSHSHTHRSDDRDRVGQRDDGHRPGQRPSQPAGDALLRSPLPGDSVRLLRRGPPAGRRADGHGPTHDRRSRRHQAVARWTAAMRTARREPRPRERLPKEVER